MSRIAIESRSDWVLSFLWFLGVSILSLVIVASCVCMELEESDKFSCTAGGVVSQPALASSHAERVALAWLCTKISHGWTNQRQRISFVVFPVFAVSTCCYAALAVLCPQYSGNPHTIVPVWPLVILGGAFYVA